MIDSLIQQTYAYTRTMVNNRSIAQISAILCITSITLDDCRLAMSLAFGDKFFLTQMTHQTFSNHTAVMACSDYLLIIPFPTGIRKPKH